MPNKDDEDCGCTGSIDLEKTTKFFNNIINISNDKIKQAQEKRIQDLCLKLENRRFKHMFRRKYAKNGKTAEAEDGIEIMLKDSKNTIVFIQTYLMGDPSLWKINDNYNKALKGQKKIKHYDTYKEFLGDYFQSSEIFTNNNDLKRFNSKNIKEILDIRGSFKGKERMDFDLGANYFKNMGNLEKVTIRNLEGSLTDDEKLYLKYLDFDFKTIPADLSDPVKTRGPKDARYHTGLVIETDKNNTENGLLLDLNTSPRLCAIQEKAGSYIGLTPYKKNWIDTNDPVEKEKYSDKSPKPGHLETNRKINEPKDWIESLNHLFSIHNKKISSQIKVYEKAIRKASDSTTGNERLDENNFYYKFVPPALQRFYPDYAEKARLGGLKHYIDDNSHNAQVHFGYAQCFRRNIFKDDYWIKASNGNLSFIPYGYPAQPKWNDSNLKLNSKYKKYDFSFLNPEHYFYSILYNKYYWVEENLLIITSDEDSGGFTQKETRVNTSLSAALIDFTDFEYMSDKPIRCCFKKNTKWDHSIPYVYEFGNLLIGKENIYMYGADYDDDPTSKKVRSLNYGRNKRNYKDAYSDGSVIETNFDDIMKFLRDEYNTELGNKSDNSITTYEFNRYWSSKLNFSNQPFVIGVRPFQGCKNLRQVDIQLKNIAAGGKFSTFDYYFQDLKKLETVNFTENINATGTKTFSGCESLKQVTMPGLERISDGSFHNCKNLRIYTLEPRLNYIHPTAFIGCSALNNLIIKTNSSNLQKIFINKIIFSKKNNNNNIHTIEFTEDSFAGNDTYEIHEGFINNFRESLKRIIYPKNKNIETNSNFVFDINRTFEYKDKKHTYYKDLSKLPDNLLSDLSTEKLNGVKTFDLNINPSKLPPNYISLKKINNKYTIIGPGVKLNNASSNLKNYDLNNLNINNDIMDAIILGQVNTYDIVYEQPPTLPVNYVIKVNRENKKMIIGPGVNLTNADLTDVNLNGIDITNINFNNTIFKNVIASNIKINTNSTNNGYKVFKKKKNNQKFLLGPGLYFDKFDFSSMNFQELKLNNSIFRNCNFTNIDLRKADLTNCSLINCNLTNPIINFKTILIGLKSNALTYNSVNFNNLRNYKIYGKNGNGILIGPKVDLSNQNLSNLDLSGANMTEVTIYKTIINDNTKLPEKVDRNKFNSSVPIQLLKDSKIKPEVKKFNENINTIEDGETYEVKDNIILDESFQITISESGKLIINKKNTLTVKNRIFNYGTIENNGSIILLGSSSLLNEGSIINNNDIDFRGTWAIYNNSSITNNGSIRLSNSSFWENENQANISGGTVIRKSGVHN